jgi:DNA ligase-1
VDLADGESVEVAGSGSAKYTIKNTGGVYACSCPAWRNQSVAIEKRSCKHIRRLRGDDAETARVGAAAAPARPKKVNADGEEEEDSAPPLLLAHTWENDVDLTGWWMSEKLDGVRAYWDGKSFISRLGNPFHVPDWFLEKLPSTPLDGELWGGRKLFQRTVSIVRRQDKGDQWKQIQYVVFDAPAMKEPFEKRIEYCDQLIARDKPPYVIAHKHERCRGVDHLREELARVEALGGEGLMLRKPGSLYEAGRSSSLLKVKSFRDAEAKILEHVPGTGRHKGRMGSLLVQMPDGTEFNIGTGFSDAEREAPPPIGTVVTYRYQELSEAGVPRFPSYVGVRDDVKWTPQAQKTKPEAASGKSRRFEMESKFWEISVEGSSYTVKYGKLGTKGQEKTKSFSSEAAAQRESDDLIAEKTGKGYVEK